MIHLRKFNESIEPYDPDFHLRFDLSDVLTKIKMEIKVQFDRLCEKLTNKYKPKFSFVSEIKTNEHNEICWVYIYIIFDNESHKIIIFNEKLIFRGDKYGFDDYSNMNDVERIVEKQMKEITKGDAYFEINDDDL